jgi:antitoxin (DNA-binding transcriptional repressor) of toxin-antitoxin stability system
MKVTNISNLKKNLSACLQSVQRGEEFLVTDRNVPVAMIEPLPPGTTEPAMKGLVAAGVMRPRRRALDLDGLLSLPRGKCPHGLGDAIIEERDGR